MNERIARAYFYSGIFLGALLGILGGLVTDSFFSLAQSLLNSINLFLILLNSSFGIVLLIIWMSRRIF